MGSYFCQAPPTSPSLYYYTSQHAIIHMCQAPSVPPKACITEFLNLQPVIIQQILSIHSPVKRNHSLLEYTRDSDTQVSELGALLLNYILLSKINVQAITSKPFGIYLWNFTNGCIILRWCVTSKKGDSGYFGFWIMFPGQKSKSRPWHLNCLDYINET